MLTLQIVFWNKCGGDLIDERRQSVENEKLIGQDLQTICQNWCLKFVINDFMIIMLLLRELNGEKILFKIEILMTLVKKQKYHKNISRNNFLFSIEVYLNFFRKNMSLV